MEQRLKRPPKKRIQAKIDAEIYDWMYEEAYQKGLEDRIGRHLEQLLRELREYRAQKEKESEEMS